MYKVMETSITQHIMLKEVIFCFKCICLQFWSHGMHHVYILNNMHLQHIPVCMQKIKILTRTDL